MWVNSCKESFKRGSLAILFRLFYDILCNEKYIFFVAACNENPLLTVVIKVAEQQNT